METPAASSPAEGDHPPRSAARTDASLDSTSSKSPINIAQNSQHSIQKTDSPWNKIPDSQPQALSVHINGGVARASIPDDVIYGSQPLWSDCIVGYFIDEPPYVGKIHAAINRLWRTKKQAETKGTMIAVDFLNPTTALFRIPNKQSRDFILGKHVWHIGTTPMVVQQWSPTTAKSAPDMTRIPVWVDFRGVPDALYAEKGLKFLGNIVGKYQSIHATTEKCLNLEVARVLALVNFEQELVNTIALTGTGGEEITVKVSYPWVPLKCASCNKWGHSIAKCPLNKQDEQRVVDTVDETTKAKDTVMSPGQSTSPAHQIHMNTGTPQQAATTDINRDQTENKSDEIEAGWNQVSGRKSPRKFNTSPRSDTMHTPIDNPFNVLQTEEHEEGEIEEENETIRTEDVVDVPAQNVSTTDVDNVQDEPAADVQDVDIADEGKQRLPGGTRGRRGRPRKNTSTITHSDLAITNAKKKGKASFGKH